MLIRGRKIHETYHLLSCGFSVCFASFVSSLLCTLLIETKQGPTKGQKEREETGLNALKRVNFHCHFTDIQW